MHFILNIQWTNVQTNLAPPIVFSINSQTLSRYTIQSKKFWKFQKIQNLQKMKFLKNKNFQTSLSLQSFLEHFVNDFVNESINSPMINAKKFVKWINTIIIHKNSLTRQVQKTEQKRSLGQWKILKNVRQKFRPTFSTKIAQKIRSKIRQKYFKKMFAKNNLKNVRRKNTEFL